MVSEGKEMEHIRPPPELDFSTTDGNLPERWRKWEQTMKLYLNIAMHERNEKDKCSAFLYIIGQEGREIFNTMTIPDEDIDKIDTLFTKFKDYCAPRENITVWRHRFHTRVQGKIETIDQYVTDLKIISKNCKFGALEDEMLRDRIVCGVYSEKVKERLLRDNELTLQKALSMCRANEESQNRLKDLQHEEHVDAVKYKQSVKASVGNKFPSTQKYMKGNVYQPKKQSVSSKPINTKSFTCGKCGSQHEKGKCPAFGKKCNRCHKLGHFASKCRTKSIHSNELETDEMTNSCETSEKFFIGAISSGNSQDEIYSSLEINNIPIKFKLDTGSQVVGHRLSRLIKVTLATEKLQSDFSPIEEFPSVFTGLGCLKEPYTIRVDSSVPPVVHSPRQIPVAFREELKKTLDDMEAKEVIKKVDQPTDWVNSLVIAEKSKTGKLRICLDPRDLNEAIKREHFQLPTIEDITTRLSGATIFSKLDANSGYWQIPLDEASQLLTTFHTPYGRYCFRRMPFGIKSAQEVFQKRIAQHFDSIEGVEVVIDDILVWGEIKRNTTDD
ncbi:uncharacterized protein LOC134232211 [Saccostrea cucullata]|uniref:uncharacterized protein LOC134232211 n=1 Tax=Saccostrea cuccullata TaxID=36930 RepID=UPI002ED42C40